MKNINQDSPKKKKGAHVPSEEGPWEFEEYKEENVILISGNGFNALEVLKEQGFERIDNSDIHEKDGKRYSICRPVWERERVRIQEIK